MSTQAALPPTPVQISIPRRLPWKRATWRPLIATFRRRGRPLQRHLYPSCSQPSNKLRSHRLPLSPALRLRRGISPTTIPPPPPRGRIPRRITPPLLLPPVNPTFRPHTAF